jgi:two-component system, OmpR family, KDP operon response regulator KdpE
VSAPAHVLIVEDSDAVTSAMRILVESGGHRVSTAATIAQALAIGTSDPAWLVLLDITLPDGDGLVLVEPLRKAGAKRIVALTGHDDAATRQRCLDAGCDEVLVKPVPARELVSRVDGWTTESP